MKLKKNKGEFKVQCHSLLKKKISEIGNNNLNGKAQ